MNLARLHDLFWRGARGEAALHELDAAFTGYHHRDAAERFRTYNSAYYLRLERCLAATFPRVTELLGEQTFREVARAYVARHPSTNPAIEFAGSAFPEFVRSEVAAKLFARCAPANGLSDIDAVADVAALEWARLSALLAPNAPAQASADEVVPERFALARLKFLPSLVITDVGAAGLDLWMPPTRRFADRCVVAFYRTGFVVRSLTLDPDEARALRSALAGSSLGVVCESFVSAAAPVARALAVVGRWFHRGWVAAIETAEEVS